MVVNKQAESIIFSSPHLVMKLSFNHTKVFVTAGEAFACLVLFWKISVFPLTEHLYSIKHLFLNIFHISLLYPITHLFVVVQSLSHVRLFATPWTAAWQVSLSTTNSWSLLKFMSIELVMPSTHLILSLVSSHLQSFPASGSFPMSQFFASRGQSIGASASASVLPMNIQDWVPLGWTGWISLQSKGLSRVFSNTTVQKHQILPLSVFFMVQLLHSHMTTGKTIALTIAHP